MFLTYSLVCLPLRTPLGVARRLLFIAFIQSPPFFLSTQIPSFSYSLLLPAL
eukprot:m.42082 g.42082  ORF g.42082 m.42082 type:complete len:52 (+) comp10603_c0_seq4:1272-1427(+)